MPESQVEFAQAKGVSERTVRRWKKDPAFQELLDQRRTQQRQRAEGGAVAAAPKVGHGRPASDPRVVRRLAPPEPAGPRHDEVVAEAQAAGVVDPAQQDYVSVRESVLEQAREGERGAVELYMKYWGAELARQEREGREAQFRDLSDDQLLDELLALVGVAAIESWLARVSA